MPRKLVFLIQTIIILMLVCGCLQRKIVYQDIPQEKCPTVISGTIDHDKIINALAQIDLITPQGYQPLKAALILKKPSYMRLELLPVIGTPDFILAATPAQLRIFIPSRGEFYQGRPTGSNLERFMPLAINIEDIVMIASGAYPYLPGDSVSCKGYQDGKSLRIEMKDQSGNSQILFIGEKNRLLKLVRNDESGREIYHVRYEDYKSENELAGKITINMADSVTSVSIKYSSVKIEEASDLSIFELPVPDGVKTIMLD
jgi:hypothetical protein